MSEPRPLPEPTPASWTRRRALGALGLLGASSLSACSSEATAGTAHDEGDDTSEASLVSLTPTVGAFNETFSAARTSYTQNVTNGVATIGFTPTFGAGYTCTVQGSAVASGAVSSAIALSVGTNSVSIVVTSSATGRTTEYTVVVTRAAQTCTLIPQETDGPYPLYSVLSDPTMVRADITEGKAGVPLTVHLSLIDVNDQCSPIEGAAVYVWHCDADGAYSGYGGNQNGNHLGETFCRGLQVSDASGNVTFQTIYPGWYPGRITHVHFEVFLDAVLQTPASAVSQLAFPQSVTQAVYAVAPYASNGQNTSVPSFSADNVFSDGVGLQLATVTGDTTTGFVATLTIGVAV